MFEAFKDIPLAVNAFYWQWLSPKLSGQQGVSIVFAVLDFEEGKSSFFLI